MANPPPLWPSPTDSPTDLLRKILTNLAFLIENGGGGGGAVTKLIAGTNITLSPPTGLGAVTINSTGGSGGNAGTAVTNNTGNTTITPTQPTQTVKLTFTGAAGNRIIILDTAGRSAGDKLFLDLVFPATSGLVISVRNATSGGTLLLPVETFGGTQNFTTDGNILSGHWEFTFIGGAWVFDTSNLPA